MWAHKMSVRVSDVCWPGSDPTPAKPMGSPRTQSPGRPGLGASAPSDGHTRLGPPILQDVTFRLTPDAPGSTPQPQAGREPGAGRGSPHTCGPSTSSEGRLPATEKKAGAASGSLRRATETSGARGGVRKCRVIPVLLVEDQPWWELPASWGPLHSNVGGLGGRTAVGQGRWWSRESGLGAQPLCTPGPHSLYGVGFRRPQPSAGRELRVGRVAGSGWMAIRPELLGLTPAPLTGHGHHHRLRGQGAADMGREDHRLLLLRVCHLLLRAPSGRCSVSGAFPHSRQGSPEEGACSQRYPCPPYPQSVLRSRCGRRPAPRGRGEAPVAAAP